jgi:peptidoglycan hydrolase-like protein with peptidoglycan-binding domain
MKIKKSELEKIIAEEIENIVSELDFTDLVSMAQPKAAAKAGMRQRTDRATALQNKLLQGVDNLIDTENLQKVLNDAGFNVGKPDGRVGGKTIGAIKALQKALGVKPDGKYGKNTHAAWQKLKFAKKANLLRKSKLKALKLRMNKLKDNMIDLYKKAGNKKTAEVDVARDKYKKAQKEFIAAGGDLYGGYVSAGGRSKQKPKPKPTRRPKVGEPGGGSALNRAYPKG